MSKRIPTKGTNDFTWSSVISKKQPDINTNLLSLHLESQFLVLAAHLLLLFSVPMRQAKKIPQNHHIFSRIRYTFRKGPCIQKPCHSSFVVSMAKKFPRNLHCPHCTNHWMILDDLDPGFIWRLGLNGLDICFHCGGLQFLHILRP